MPALGKFTGFPFLRVGFLPLAFPASFLVDFPLAGVFAGWAFFEAASVAGAAFSSADTAGATGTVGATGTAGATGRPLSSVRAGGKAAGTAGTAGAAGTVGAADGSCTATGAIAGTATGDLAGGSDTGSTSPLTW